MAEVHMTPEQLAFFAAVTEPVRVEQKKEQQRCKKHARAHDFFGAYDELGTPRKPLVRRLIEARLFQLDAAPRELPSPALNELPAPPAYNTPSFVTEDFISLECSSSSPSIEAVEHFQVDREDRMAIDSASRDVIDVDALDDEGELPSSSPNSGTCRDRDAKSSPRAPDMSADLSLPSIAVSQSMSEHLASLDAAPEPLAPMLLAKEPTQRPSITECLFAAPVDKAGAESHHAVKNSGKRAFLSQAGVDDSVIDSLIDIQWSDLYLLTEASWMKIGAPGPSKAKALVVKLEIHRQKYQRVSASSKAKRTDKSAEVRRSTAKRQAQDDTKGQQMLFRRLTKVGARAERSNRESKPIALYPIYVQGLARAVQLDTLTRLFDGFGSLMRDKDFGPHLNQVAPGSSTKTGVAYTTSAQEARQIVVYLNRAWEMGGGAGVATAHVGPSIEAPPKKLAIELLK